MSAPVCLPAEVRPVPGFPGMSVTAAGEVYGPRGLRKPSPGTNGYLYVSVRVPGKVTPAKLRIHHAVLLAWVGPRPEGQEGRHLDGDLTRNDVGNLAWSTHVDNVADKEAHGTIQRGSASGTAKLTEADVLAMRELRPSLSLSALGRRFGVAKSTVQDVMSGRSWSHLTREES